MSFNSVSNYCNNIGLCNPRPSYVIIQSLIQLRKPVCFVFRNFEPGWHWSFSKRGIRFRNTKRGSKSGQTPWELVESTILPKVLRTFRVGHTGSGCSKVSALYDREKSPRHNFLAQLAHSKNDVRSAIKNSIIIINVIISQANSMLRRLFKVIENVEKGFWSKYFACSFNKMCSMHVP